MADGLSAEEREKLLKVMDRAKEFDQTNKEGRMQMTSLPTEGQLYKWTNPLKGWQPRWFYVNREQGVLHYCMTEEKRKQPPRASLHLWGAVVSPSDEDSQSFTIQGANNECYRLKAANAKDRQWWVSKLRTEVEHANTLASVPHEQTVHQSMDKSTSSATVNSLSVSHDSTSRKDSNSTAKKHGRKSQLSAPLNLSLTKLTLSGPPNKKRHKHKSSLQSHPIQEVSSEDLPGGADMLDAITKMNALQELLIEQIEASSNEVGVKPAHKDILLLKATSQAAVQSVHEVLSAMNIQINLTSSGNSPTHANAISPIGASQSPLRKPTTLRRNRPMSMIDTSSKQQFLETENDLDNIFIRSNSAVEVSRNKNNRRVPQVSHEAP